MWTSRYFTPKYWPTTYFPKVGADAVVSETEPIELTLPGRDFSFTLNSREQVLTLPNRPENP